MRLRATWLLLGLPALMIAGCGDGNGDADTDQVDEATSDADDGAEASDDPVELRFTTATAEGSEISNAVEAWGEMVEEATDGRVSVDYFHGGSLIPATEEPGALEDGRVDAAYVPALYAPDRWPLFNHPPTFVVDNPVDGLFAWHDTLDENEHLAEELRDGSLYAVGFIPISELAVGTEQPLESYTDLEGLRIRSTGESMDAAMAAAGADPSYVAPAEVYESVSRGVFDAWTGLPMSLAVAQGMHELTPAINGVGLGPGSTAALFLSAQTWESFDADLQQTLDEVTRDWYLEVGDILATAEQEACDQLAAEDASVTLLPDAEIEAWSAQALPDITDIWESQAGELYEQDVIDDFLATLEANLDAAAGESGYVNGIEACAEEMG